MREKHSSYFINLSKIVMIASFLTIFSYSSLASTINVECTKGATIPHYDISFPNAAIGNYPNRVASWELNFERGIYRIRIASYLQFTPYIYKQINGQYRYTGFPVDIKRQNDRSGRPFYYYDFTADHLNDPYPNRKWLVQIKPVSQAQNTRHTIRLITKPISCKEVDAQRGCSCTVIADHMSGTNAFCTRYWERRGTAKNKVLFIHIYNYDKKLTNEQLQARGWTSAGMISCREAIRSSETACDGACRQ